MYVSQILVNLFFILLIYFDQVSICQGVCPNTRVIPGQLAASSAMVTLFENSARNYIETRRNRYNVDVRLDFHWSSRDIDGLDNKALFRIPQSPGWAGNNEFVFPLFARALVMVFNIPGIKNLDMPIDLIANIYMGKISSWNDPEIKKYNPNISLPAEKILVLARQEESDMSTALFTGMLSRINDDWNTKYGGPFKGPDFVNGTCCVSKKWGNVINYYPVDIVGVVGFILSIPYTIGYATRPDVEQYNLTKINLLDSGASSKIVDPTIKAIQLPMVDAANTTSESMVNENGTIAVSGSNMKVAGAYPMAANTYIIVKRNYQSDDIGDCCLIEELIGFLETIITPPDPNLFTNNFYADVPSTMANLINETILQKITCDKHNIYQQYIRNLNQMQTSLLTSSLKWPEIAFIILSILLFLAAVTVGSVYLYKKAQRRQKISNVYIIDALRLNVNWPNENQLHYQGSTDGLSHSDKRTVAQQGALVLSKELLFLKNTFLNGDLDENTKVNLADLPMPRNHKGNHPAKSNVLSHWADKTRSLATKLRKSSNSHRNFAAFIGLVELSDGKTYTIFEYCSKGTLHYNLATCRYRLTDSIRRYLAVDVANGLEYLHTRVGVVHGQLNSLTCFLDMAWTVKIGLWDQTSLHYSECTKQGMLCENAFATEDCRWRCTPAEVKGQLYDDKGIEALTRLVYLDPQLPATYPQPAVDVFSFGILLAEIFTAKLPFYDELMTNSTTIINHSTDNVVTPDMINKQAHMYQDMLEKKFADPTNIRIPHMPISTPKYIVNIIEASMRPDPTKRPTMKTILRHLSVSTSDMNKGGLVDAMMETMDTYAEQLEEKVEERTAELKQVTTRMRDLLNEVLPPQIAEKLFQGVAVPPEYFECVTVYFSDIVGFTIISARSTPIQVMSFLNDLWLMFDSIIQDFDVYKVDTIGDAYMVCSGLPNRNGVEHCRQIARLSLALLDTCKRFKIAHLPEEKLHIRIGLNSGPVTAGVVGLKMPQYCVFGDTVNTAARMESTSLPGRIQISSSTYMLLVENFPGEFSYEYRGEISVKGKGNMLTYWLLSSDDFSKKSKHSARSTTF